MSGPHTSDCFIYRYAVALLGVDRRGLCTCGADPSVTAPERDLALADWHQRRFLEVNASRVERLCICADPENCTERVPGRRCKKDYLNEPAHWARMREICTCPKPGTSSSSVDPLCPIRLPHPWHPVPGGKSRPPAGTPEPTTAGGEKAGTPAAPLSSNQQADVDSALKCYTHGKGACICLGARYWMDRALAAERSASETPAEREGPRHIHVSGICAPGCPACAAVKTE